MGIMTVNRLLEECKRLKKEGFGDRQVYISRDDEGNGFHPLFYPFQTDTNKIQEAVDYGMCESGEAEDIVLLG